MASVLPSIEEPEELRPEDSPPERTEEQNSLSVAIDDSVAIEEPDGRRLVASPAGRTGEQGQNSLSVTVEETGPDFRSALQQVQELIPPTREEAAAMVITQAWRTSTAAKKQWLCSRLGLDEVDTSGAATTRQLAHMEGVCRVPPERLRRRGHARVQGNR